MPTIIRDVERLPVSCPLGSLRTYNISLTYSSSYFSVAENTSQAILKWYKLSERLAGDRGFRERHLWYSFSRVAVICIQITIYGIRCFVRIRLVYFASSLDSSIYKTDNNRTAQSFQVLFANGANFFSWCDAKASERIKFATGGSGNQRHIYVLPVWKSSCSQYAMEKA